MVSIFVNWESVRCSSRVQRIIADRLPPHDTPRVAPCIKAKFSVQHRHAAVGICKQRMTKFYTYRDLDVVLYAYTKLYNS